MVEINKNKGNENKEIIEDWSLRKKRIEYHLEELHKTIDNSEFTEKQSIVLIVKIEGIHVWLEKLQSKRKNQYGKPKSD